MKKLIVVLCVIIIKSPSVLLAEEVKNSTVVTLQVTELISDVLKAISVKSDENATTKEKAEILSKLVKEAGIMAALITRHLKSQETAFRNYYLPQLEKQEKILRELLEQIQYL